MYTHTHIHHTHTHTTHTHNTHTHTHTYTHTHTHTHTYTDILSMIYTTIKIISDRPTWSMFFKVFFTWSNNPGLYCSTLVRGLQNPSLRLLNSNPLSYQANNAESKARQLTLNHALFDTRNQKRRSGNYLDVLWSVFSKRQEFIDK